MSKVHPPNQHQISEPGLSEIGHWQTRKLDAASEIQWKLAIVDSEITIAADASRSCLLSPWSTWGRVLCIKLWLELLHLDELRCSFGKTGQQIGREHWSIVWPGEDFQLWHLRLFASTARPVLWRTLGRVHVPDIVHHRANSRCIGLEIVLNEATVMDGFAALLQVALSDCTAELAESDKHLKWLLEDWLGHLWLIIAKYQHAASNTMTVKWMLQNQEKLVGRPIGQNIKENDLLTICHIQTREQSIHQGCVTGQSSPWQHVPNKQIRFRTRQLKKHHHCLGTKTKQIFQAKQGYGTVRPSLMPLVLPGRHHSRQNQPHGAKDMVRFCLPWQQLTWKRHVRKNADERLPYMVGRAVWRLSQSSQVSKKAAARDEPMRLHLSWGCCQASGGA